MSNLDWDPDRQQHNFFDREQVYRTISEYCDRYGNLTVTQRELAPVIGCSYQALSEIFSEFIEMKMIEKRHKKFRLLYDPDDIPWGPTFNKLRDAYRKSEFSRYRVDYSSKALK